MTSQLGIGRPRRGRPILHVLIVLLASALVLQGCSRGGGLSAPRDRVPDAGSMQTWPPSRPLVGAYMSRYSSTQFEATFGRYPDVETVYLDADRVTTPDLPEIRQQIDRGISPVITLGYRNGPFTRAEIAAWGPEVRDYFRTFVGGLDDLSRYARGLGNGTRVYFGDEHEAVVKINQSKYTFAGYHGGLPTVGDSAAAWNRVMGDVARQAPNVVRTYWYGGSGANEDVFAAALKPDLIQLATMDIYRWRYDSPAATPEQEWGDKVARLSDQPWMRDASGALKPWAVTEWGTDATHGDAANARFVSEALDFFASHGASFAVYFYRVDSNDDSNDFVFGTGDDSRTFEAFDSAVQG